LQLFLKRPSFIRILWATHTTVCCQVRLQRDHLNKSWHQQRCYQQSHDHGVAASTQGPAGEKFCTSPAWPKRCRHTDQKSWKSTNVEDEKATCWCSTQSCQFWQGNILAAFRVKNYHLDQLWGLSAKNKVHKRPASEIKQRAFPPRAARQQLDPRSHKCLDGHTGSSPS